MIEPEHPRLSVSRQCLLLPLPRATYYHQAKPVSPKTLRFMQLIDEFYMLHPFYGSRHMMRALHRQGNEINRKRTPRLMRIMGLAAIYRKPNLLRANDAHRGHPYLLRGLPLLRSNQVWATDMTYIPVAGGVAYL